MQMFVMAVSDRAVGEFMNPFFAPSRAAGQRAFTDEVNRAGSPMNAHPEDYELHCLGQFDSASGAFLVAKETELVVRGKDVLKGTV